MLIGLALWLAPPAGGVDGRAWHLLAIFVATIAAFITKPLPMGAIAIIALALTTLTRTLTITDALAGFGNSTIWLIVLAFFIARGFIKTGLGARVAYAFVGLVGRRTLGLAYGLAASDLLLAPAIPSNTARAGGVVFPILRLIASAFGSEPLANPRKMGRFLTVTGYQVNVITSAMFLTAMAANPLATQLAAGQGVLITWTGWALAALVPGLVRLIVVPLAIYRLYPPEVKHTPGASTLARTKLAEMGAVSRPEWIMVAVFALLLVLWVFGQQLGGIDATSTALIGLAALLLTRVLSWDDVKREEGAWDTLVWFAALVMMADQLNQLGLIPWVGEAVAAALAGVPWVAGFAVLALVYFYSHYLFASNTAHVAAMYGAFLSVAIAVGTPAMLAALVFAFFSSLFGSLTHYASGPAPVLFGAGYVDVADWWKLGGLISVLKHHHLDRHRRRLVEAPRNLVSTSARNFLAASRQKAIRS